MEVDAEPAEAGDVPRRVGDAVLAKGPLRVRRNLGQHHFLDLDAVERRSVGADDAAVHAKRRRLAGHQQQIAGFAFGHERKPGLEP
jgi:hypothetical protein